MIGSGAQNRIDSFLLLQQIAKILVGGDFVVWRFRGEVVLDLGFDGQAPSGSFVIKGVEILRFDRVGHGNDLRVSLLKERADIGSPLAAAADNGNVDLLTGRDKSRAAENMSRYDGEAGNCRGCAANKRSSAEAARGLVSRLIHGLSSASAKPRT